VFAPGYLGELTRIVPFEMAGAVLADCGAIQRQVRKLPVLVAVCLLLAAALFERAGYPQIRLTALMACGTRAIIDAVFGPAADGEPAYAAGCWVPYARA